MLIELSRSTQLNYILLNLKIDIFIKKTNKFSF